MQNRSAKHSRLTLLSSEPPKTVVVDDLDLRRLYDRLKINEMRLDLAADAAGAGLWSLDLTTNQLWVNRNVRDIFHFPDSEEIDF